MSQPGWRRQPALQLRCGCARVAQRYQRQRRGLDCQKQCVCDEVRTGYQRGRLVLRHGIQGTRHLEYTLSQVGTRPELAYPAGCDPVLDMAAMTDATDLTRLPGLLAFTSQASVADIFTFYQGKLTAQGWEKNSDLGQGTQSSAAIYDRSDSNVAATIIVDTQGSSQRVTVLIPMQSSAADSTPGTPTTPAVSTDPSTRVSLALSSLLGMVPKQPGPPSFHIESINQEPVWAGGKIAQSQEAMSADVQGKDVHYTLRTTPPGGSASTREAYLISNQEYDVANGKVQPATANSMAWTMWPLNLELMLATGSTGATASGTETLGERTADVYTLAGAGAAIPGRVEYRCRWPPSAARYGWTSRRARCSRRCWITRRPSVTTRARTTEPARGTWRLRSARSGR